ncbi:hypothetical protein WJX81_005341 [Elliptochloris bilobata]|uniref:protein-serine/threonine phosphatase n=1 Tax=Elliptochloris bilobata TaxID=381761 RepID=A0AAW1RTZ5_9CHLO
MEEREEGEIEDGEIPDEVNPSSVQAEAASSRDAEPRGAPVKEAPSISGRGGVASTSNMRPSASRLPGPPVQPGAPQHWRAGHQPAEFGWDAMGSWCEPWRTSSPAIDRQRQSLGELEPLPFNGRPAEQGHRTRWRQREPAQHSASMEPRARQSKPGQPLPGGLAAASVGVPHAMKSLEGVCRDLAAAQHKLGLLAELTQRRELDAMVARCKAFAEILAEQAAAAAEGGWLGAPAGAEALAAAAAIALDAHGTAVAEDVKTLLRQQRLCLVLDLDHTLVNSARFDEVDAELAGRLEARLVADAARLPRKQRQLHCLSHIGMWTKLRPSARAFLAAAARRFELWIHTNGTRTYAHAVCELLDPTGELFGERIIAAGSGAAGDGGGANLSKRLMQGLEGREAVAIVVDDSTAVWAAHAGNLLAVERYIYFPSSRRQFGLRGKSLLEVNRDECPDKGMLAVALGVLERVHAHVFKELSGNPVGLAGTPPGTPEHGLAAWDVRSVLRALRAQVLAGVRILFSRVIPLEQAPASHTLWCLAEAFGAECTTDADPGVTHVVASTRGTQKVFWALQSGKHIVLPAWLECSCTLWARASEAHFPVPAASAVPDLK